MDQTLLPQPIKSVCVYCGSSPTAGPNYLALAASVGCAIAARGWRLVYGGGGLGLMGASALAAHDAGGDVLGILPRFLETREPPPAHIETRRVDTMHERKMMMFELSDAFLVLPGGIGTLEEVVETLSWRRLGLHSKPTVFVDKMFWGPFIGSLDHLVAENFAPPVFKESYALADNAEEALCALEEGHALTALARRA